MKKVWVPALIVLAGLLLGTALGYRQLRSSGVVRYWTHRFLISKNFVEVVSGDLAGSLQSVRMVPHISDGKFQGFKFLSIDPDSLFLKLGLNPGDIVFAINDVNLDNPGMGVEAFRGKNPCKVHVLREDERILLHYTVL